MAKNGKTVVTGMGFQLIAATLAAILIGIIVFNVMGVVGKHFVYKKARGFEYVEENTKKAVADFQNFVTENNIISHDVEKIDEWVQAKRNIVMVVFDENGVYYDSNWGTDKKDDFDGKPNNNGYRPTYEIQFEDKTCEIEIVGFFVYKDFFVYGLIRTVVSFAVAVIILLMLIKRKTDYINQLQDEVSILEGGNLNYKITVKGNDELGYLAESIENMRCAIVERQVTDKKIQESSHQLIMAMSHDLRTPLTVLIGFLDILCDKKYQTQEKLDEYLVKSRDKAYRIKELSDKLFEYFLAYNYGEKEMDFEEAGIDVINELVEDFIFPLTEQKGCDVVYNCQPSNISVDINIDYFRRVLDNIFSNIQKYADLDKQINIEITSDDDELKLTFENYVKESLERVESTNIGLDVCKRLMERHNGSFEYEKNDEKFKAYVTLPLA